MTGLVGAVCTSNSQSIVEDSLDFYFISLIIYSIYLSLTGLAYVSAMCTPSSQSIVEDGFDFIMITVASHELGHRYA